MSEHAPEAVQAIHDAWVAEKAAGGVPDPGFPGDDGGLYYSDDDDFWAHFDAPQGRFAPESLTEAVYAETLHPRDRLGKWRDKPGLPRAPKLPLGPSGGFVEAATKQWDQIADKLAPRFKDDPDFAHLAGRLARGSAAGPRRIGSIHGFTMAGARRDPVAPIPAALDAIWTSWIGTDKPGLHGPLLVAAGQEFGIDAPVDLDEKGKAWVEDEAAMRALRKYLRAVHEETQGYLREHGVTHVRLYRGLVFDDANPFPSGPGVHEIESAPLSSWSDDYGFAYLFTTGVTGAGDGTNGAMVRLDVPAERVLGLPHTGLGDWFEGTGANEFVILGGTDQAEVVAWHPPGLLRDVTERDFEAVGRGARWHEFQGTTHGRAATMPEGYGQTAKDFHP